MKTKLLTAALAACLSLANPLLAEEVALGDLTISDPFARATMPNAPVAGGFMTITNSGTDDDRLIAARTDISGEVQIHEMQMEDGVMRMRELPDGLPIPAGGTVDLAPGGFHIMFMDLSGPLIEGETVNVTLIFERAGEVEVPLAVMARDAGKMGGMTHGE